MHFFIDRPIFATVISIVIVVVGGLAYVNLPVSQYPDIALPTVVVRAQYAGATAEIVAETVATPLEQEINGVEGMLYMESSSTSDGTMQLTITFEQGADLDDAQVLVQNRVSLAEPRLPAEVRQVGVTTRKSSPDMLMVVHLFSPDDSRDALYISNYVLLRIKDVLARQDGVGDVTIFGSREYSMRIWLNTERLATLDMTTGDVVAALREQNVQVAAGAIGQPPTNSAQGAFQLNISTQGRLEDVEQFKQVIVKTGDGSNLVRLGDVARVELGAQDYSTSSYLDGREAIGIAVFQRPGSNAVATAENIVELMDRLSEEFPIGLEHAIAYNPTKFVEESINEVFRTLIEATVLVVLTVFLFLQNWRATIIPVVAIPVSLIGTFAVMMALGFSLNNLSLFGLVLAIGIVVDDAIVVVENVEHWIERGLSARDAAHKAMGEVGSALVAATLVLIAVFVPTSFIPGISGEFYRQFAITIAVSTTISLVVSLTLSPAMCALLLRGKPVRSSAGESAVDTNAVPASRGRRIGQWLMRALGAPLRWFFAGFNWLFDRGVNTYTGIVARLVRVSFVGMIIYAGLLALTWVGFHNVPGGFIPQQDQGYIIVSIELPPSASLARSGKVAKDIEEIAMEVPGIAHAVSVVGFSGATRANNSNAAAVFVTLSDSKERAAQGQTADEILAQLRQRTAVIDEANVLVIPPPPVPGIGTGGGFKMQVQDRSGAGSDQLESVATDLAAAAMEQPGMAMVYTMFRNNTPQLYADVDRTKARILDVPLSNLFDTLQTALGSVYVNDFNFLGRTYRVTAQADSQFRTDPDDVLKLRTRSSNGSIVPLGSLVRMNQRTAPDRVVHYNLYPAADISGALLPGVSTGQAMSVMERLADERLPEGFGYEWTDLSYQEKLAGNTALFIFPLCVLFVFLALSAQYESWLLPLAVILIVPMGLLFAIGGVWLMGMDNNILTQIGFIVLVALACKNAILIVEFAKSEEDSGKNPFDAAVSSARLRVRPILMTSIAFILGVVPLVIATGAGSEMRRALGTAVFSGMIGVTICGLFLTPIFYVVLRQLAGHGKQNA
ncbi:efflux RND transporter permease subunit [Stieleria sp. TO1_6]|uniref:efflux RND transporter permease subunit n=1 Tax=Stieleria tagensis TaxID=2956795 RepID=UPI00209BAFCD|nr:multidrug efflux RND transporter permease subunit [Stieleria tagensis]MCO8123888.1 efflux RND transporter permease subunit [Stieleria tagensis]